MHQRLLSLMLVTPLLVLTLWGCGQKPANEYGSPEAACFALLGALDRAAMDPESAWAFLGPETRTALEARADRARAAGVDVAHPLELLHVARMPSREDVREVRREQVTSRGAELTLVTYLDVEMPITLDRDESLWTTELGLRTE